MSDFPKECKSCSIEPDKLVSFKEVALEGPRNHLETSKTPTFLDEILHDVYPTQSRKSYRKPDRALLISSLRLRVAERRSVMCVCWQNAYQDRRRNHNVSFGNLPNKMTVFLRIAVLYTAQETLATASLILPYFN